MTPTNIVCSRYKRDVSFVYRINDGKDIHPMIYDKENPANPYNVPVNKGNEASVYLKYVVDNYDTLSEFTFFIHDEEYAWHHTGSIVDKYKEAVASGEKYYNINDLCLWGTNAITPHMYRLFKHWYNKYVNDYIPFDSIPTINGNFTNGYRGSAQFLVHRDNIRCLPKAFYERLYEWIITTDLPTFWSSRFLEWSWHIFWYISSANT
jgi:hypothetical protein